MDPSWRRCDKLDVYLRGLHRLLYSIFMWVIEIDSWWTTWKDPALIHLGGESYKGASSLFSSTTTFRSMPYTYTYFTRFHTSSSLSFLPAGRRTIHEYDTSPDRGPVGQGAVPITARSQTPFLVSMIWLVSQALGMEEREKERKEKRV